MSAYPALAAAGFRRWSTYRAATAAGLLVLECEQPHRKARRGKGKSDPIDAHLAVVFAALAVSKRIEHATGWTISKFVKTLRRYRQVTLTTGQHTFTADQPIPDDIGDALAKIHGKQGD